MAFVMQFGDDQHGSGPLSARWYELGPRCPERRGELYSKLHPHTLEVRPAMLDTAKTYLCPKIGPLQAVRCPRPIRAKFLLPAMSESSVIEVGGDSGASPRYRELPASAEASAT
ncbi:unnamed protein product, partial [Polarella glacialis]